MKKLNCKNAKIDLKENFYMPDEKEQKNLSTFAKVKHSQNPNDYLKIIPITTYKVTHPLASRHEQRRTYFTLEEALTVTNRAIHRAAVQASKEERAHKLVDIPQITIGAKNCYTYDYSKISALDTWSARSAKSELEQRGITREHWKAYEDNFKIKLIPVKAGKDCRVLYDKYGYSVVYHDKILSEDGSNSVTLFESHQGKMHSNTILLMVDAEDSDSFKKIRTYYPFSNRAGNKTILYFWYPICESKAAKKLSEQQFIEGCISNIENFLNLNSTEGRFTRHGRTTSLAEDDRLLINELLPFTVHPVTKFNPFVTIDSGNMAMLKLFLKKAYAYLK